MNIDRLGRLDLSDVKYVDPASGEQRVRKGDVLFNNTNSAELVGKTAHVGQGGDLAFSNHMTRLRAPNGVDPKFLSAQLHWLWMGGFFRGLLNHHVNQASVATRALVTVLIRLAPVREQRRIARAIEEHFSRLDAAGESLRRAQRLLKTLRDSALRVAVEGDWEVQPLDFVLTTLRNGVFVSRPAVDPPGVPIFRISAVRPLALDVGDIRYSQSDADIGGYFVNEGDLLFTRYSGNPNYVGACACVPSLPRPTLHPDKLIRAVVDRSLAEPKYVAIAVSIGEGRRSIEQRRKTTAGQVGIAGSQLRTVPIPLPPLDEQRRIVTEVERQLSLIDALAAAIDTALARSAALRRAILERAFTGKLVPQDPSDEPASVLLERIAADRGATAGTPPKRRTAARPE